MIKKEAIQRISVAVREKYGEMVSISNVIEFLFDHNVCSPVDFRNYYIRAKYQELKESTDLSDNKIFLQLGMETHLSKEMARYVVYPLKMYSSDVA